MTDTNTNTSELAVVDGEGPSQAKAKNWMTGEEFSVGDVVTRGHGDLQRIIDINSAGDLIVVECIREPIGWLNEDGTREEPWCRVGFVESNLTRRYSYPDGLTIEGTIKRDLVSGASSVERDCICCGQPFTSRGLDNRVCDPCHDRAPEF
jgi:hypothetical protein